jgi:ribose 5-phosphate isomerase A
MIDNNAAKRAAGYAAAQLVQDGMLVGLGTGSTAKYFIEALIERCHAGLKIKAIASSKKSLALAAEGGISLISDDALEHLDLTIDGADEITLTKDLIKGGGGALLREKIIAAASRQIIFIVDESKIVTQLGAFPLPVEIAPFGYKAILRHIDNLGYQGIVRRTSIQELFVTDNGNYITDLHMKEPIKNPEKLHHRLCGVPGVIETGLFYHLPSKILVGYQDGSTKLID